MVQFQEMTIECKETCVKSANCYQLYHNKYKR